MNDMHMGDAFHYILYNNGCNKQVMANFQYTQSNHDLIKKNYQFFL